MRSPFLPLALLAVSLTLGGCDMLGIESATVVAEKRTAEGKALGAACRHAGRAIEDCYTLNKKSDKAAMYTGWREMDDYMRENKLEPVIPVVPRDPPKPKPKPPVEGEESEGHAAGDGHAADDGKPADKAEDKAEGHTAHKPAGKSAH
ncbi:MAG: hypothetical protein C4K60_02020 [Ideonella sp. MAG2]|nr:MAG: hypothetical protein C4K60_02020 [Ideonella sp. MAG2]